jgi:predicted nucleotidyltransferase component of viral defense system
VFARYGLERFLYRLSRSPHSDRFVLKGALLLHAWLGESGRPTRDADLLGLGDLSDAVLLDVVRGICGQSVEDDGMTFDAASIRLDVIRAEAHGGRRISVLGSLGSGRIKVQLDVGIGDATVPDPEWLDLPSLLDLPRPRLRAYRPETVVAEKLHAIVHLGLANTRMKDFYDLLILGQTRTFEEATLRKAIQATFQRRQTELPSHAPPGLTAEFASEDRRRQWTAYVERNNLAVMPELSQALAELRAWLGPLTWSRSDTP